MKKFLLICLCFAFVIGCFSGCGKKEIKIDIVDWNGDGIESEWEKPFESLDGSSRVFKNEYTIEEIENAEQMLAIDNKLTQSEDNETQVEEAVDQVIIYKLVSDIDLGNKEITKPLNLNGNILWGNNKIIDNFKLKVPGTTSSGTQDSTSSGTQKIGLIEGASAIYDLRVCLRYQKMEINYNANGEDSILISPFINVNHLENVSVKGGFFLQKWLDVTNSYKNDKALSLLSTMEHEEDNKKVVIKNCETIGIIEVKDCSTSSIDGCKVEYGDKLMISGLINTGYNANITNSRANILMNIYSRSSLTIGGLCSSAKNAFLENNKVELIVEKESYKINNPSDASVVFDFFGGLVGKLEDSEIKNCEAVFKCDAKNNNNDKSVKFAFGGAIGASKQSILSFIKVTAYLDACNFQSIVAGGSIGSEENTIARKFIVLGEINVSDCAVNYLTNFVGNSYNGFFEGIISKVNISCTGKLEEVADSSSKYSDQKEKFNVGLIFIQSKYISILEAEAESNSIATDPFNYDAFNNLNNSDYDYFLEESGKAQYMPSLNHTFSEFNINLNIREDEIIKDALTINDLLDSNQINLGGLLYVLTNEEMTYKPLIFQKNFYRQGSSFTLNEEERLNTTRKNKLISYLIEFGETNYNYNHFNQKFFFDSLDNVKDNTPAGEEFDVANLSFELVEKYVGSVFREYGTLDGKIRISNEELSKNPSPSFAIDGIRSANSNLNEIKDFYGANQFYGIYKISFSDIAEYGENKSNFKDKQQKYFEEMLESLNMYKKQEGNEFKELRIYSESSLAPNDLNFVQYSYDNYVGEDVSLKGYVDAFILNYLCNLEATNNPNSGSTRKIDYVRIESSGEDLIFYVVYPKNEGEDVARVDKIEISRLKVAESESDYNLYVISTKTKTN